MSPNVTITLVGGLLTGLLLWQLNALGDNIDGLRTDMQGQIGGLRTDMQTEIRGVRSEIGALRTDMQDGFRDIYEILLDHTDRLESTSDVNG